METQSEVTETDSEKSVVIIESRERHGTIFWEDDDVIPRMRYSASLPDGNSCCDVHRQASMYQNGEVDGSRSCGADDLKQISLSPEPEKVLMETLIESQSDSFARFLLSARHAISTKSAERRHYPSS